MIHVVQYINNVIRSISTDTSGTFTLPGSHDITATGVSTIFSFITVFCKLKCQLTCKQYPCRYVSYSGSSVSVNGPFAFDVTHEFWGGNFKNGITSPS